MISSNRYRYFQTQCNRNHNRIQRLLSRLHNIFDYLPFYIKPEIWFGIKVKVNNKTDLPFDGLLYDNLSVYLFYENERKIINYINRHFSLTRIVFI